MAEDQTDKNIQFMQAIQEISARSQNCQRFCAAMIEASERSPDLQAQFAEMLSVLDLQDMLIRRFNEEQFDVLDTVHALLEKHGSRDENGGSNETQPTERNPQ